MVEQAVGRTKHAANALTERFVGLIGGPARTKVVVLLACVLGLDSADKATVGAASTYLEHAFGINNIQIGLLVSLTSAVGAVATLPFGVYVDRHRRTRLMTWAIVTWAVAIVANAVSTSYGMLLATRLALGVVLAAATPAIASLVGDYFPPAERGRIYGYILTGELVGAGLGYMVAGALAPLSWRLSFAALALPALILAWLMYRLPEPARGGASRMPHGADDIRGEEQVEQEGSYDGAEQPAADEDDGSASELAREKVRQASVEPRPELVLVDDEVESMSWWSALKYVVRVPTNLVIIIASALGYFYFTGVRTFAFKFVKQHYGISQGSATALVVVVGAGAIAGALISGRLADRRLEQGHLAARPRVAAIAFFIAVAVFVPAVFTTLVWIALPLLTVAAVFLAAPNPPLDAARLDIMHPRLWGRAESIRTTLRTSLEAMAPLLFGYVSNSVFGGKHGLEWTFLVMLVPLVAGGIVGLIAIRTYPRDVATAQASVERTD